MIRAECCIPDVGSSANMTTMIDSIRSHFHAGEPSLFGEWSVSDRTSEGSLHVSCHGTEIKLFAPATLPITSSWLFDELALPNCRRLTLHSLRASAWRFHRVNTAATASSCRLSTGLTAPPADDICRQLTGVSHRIPG